MKTLVIIPAYNESSNIVNVINNLDNYYNNYDYIVIVRNKFLDLDFTSNLKEFNYLYKKILKRMEN